MKTPPFILEQLEFGKPKPDGFIHVKNVLSNGPCEDCQKPLVNTRTVKHQWRGNHWESRCSVCKVYLTPDGEKTQKIVASKKKG